MSSPESIHEIHVSETDDDGADDRIFACLRHVEKAEFELADARGLLRSLVGARLNLPNGVEKQDNWQIRGKPVSTTQQNGVISANFSDTEDSIVPVTRPRRVHDRTTQTQDPEDEDVKTLHMCWEDFDEISRDAKQGIIDQVMVASKTQFRASEDGEVQRRVSGTSFAQQISLGSRVGMRMHGEQVSLRPLQFVQIFPRISWLKAPVIDPQAKARIAWIFLGLFFISYECVSIPIILCFDANPEGVYKIMGEAITIYFLGDVLMSFCVGYLEEEVCILDPISISKNYLKTWFVPDILASLPLEWFVEDGGSSLRLMRFLRLLRLARLVRILKLKTILNAVQSKMEGNNMFRFGSRLFKLLGFLVMTMHWCACLWYFVGSLDTSDSENSWVHTFLNPAYAKTDLPPRYVWSLYFSLTTMTTVGYGDITPKTLSEAQFALFLLPVASVVFATLMGNLTDLVTNMNAIASRRADQRMLLANYMNWRDVPEGLRFRIRDYMVIKWEESREWPEYENTLKDELSPVLLQELMMHIHSSYLTTAPFLLWMTSYPICVRQLSSKLTTIVLDRDDHLFRWGEVCTTVYILKSGSMWLSKTQTMFQEPADRVQSQESQQSGRSSDSQAETAPAMVKMESMSASRTVSIKSNQKVYPASGCKDFKKLAKPQTLEKENLSDAEALIDSYDQLKVRDFSEKRLARRIQKNWRNKKKHEGYVQPPKQLYGLPAFRSHLVSVKGSYFGESCLWVPRSKWPDEAPKHGYFACCKKRADVVCIKREAIDELLTQFSPWLPERFEFFRVQVVKKLKRLCAEESDLVSSAGDESVFPNDTTALLSSAEDERIFHNDTTALLSARDDSVFPNDTTGPTDVLTASTNVITVSTAHLPTEVPGQTKQD